MTEGKGLYEGGVFNAEAQRTRRFAEDIVLLVPTLLRGNALGTLLRPVSREYALSGRLLKLDDQVFSEVMKIKLFEGLVFPPEFVPPKCSNAVAANVAWEFRFRPQKNLILCP